MQEVLGVWGAQIGCLDRILGFEFVTFSAATTASARIWRCASLSALSAALVARTWFRVTGLRVAEVRMEGSWLRVEGWGLRVEG